MNKKITIIVALVFIMGLVGFTGVNAATYNQPLYSTTQSTDILNDAANQYNGGQVYYVDGNRLNNDGNGTSWATAYNTLATAIATSNANIALATNRAWAARNIIYARGDRLTETLTVFPQKTDVIGVGSCDAFIGVGILGNHAPTNTYYGTRWINCNFFPAANGDIMTITSSGSGLQFIGCRFLGVWGSYIAPSAIDITGHPMAKIMDCSFEGAFSADVIDIGGGDCSGMRITGNTIIGGVNDGIVVSGATVIGVTGIGKIADNVIYVVACTINDGDDDAFIITGNILISDAATGTASVNVDERWSAGNWFTDATRSGTLPVLDGAD